MKRAKFQVEVDQGLVDWIDECVRKRTFENRSRLVELAVAFCRYQAVSQGLSQETSPELRANIPFDWEKFSSPPPSFGSTREQSISKAVPPICTFDATLSPGGRITLPQASMKMVGLKPGMILRVEVKNAMSASVGITKEELEAVFKGDARGAAAVAVAADADAKKRRR